MSISLYLFPYINTYSSPHQILQHVLFVINNLNADSSGTTKCKSIGKVEGPPLQTMERNQPILPGGRGYACIFSTGCRFANLDLGQAGSSCFSPPGTSFLHCHDHKKQKGNSSAAVASLNSQAPGAAGGPASLM